MVLGEFPQKIVGHFIFFEESKLSFENNYVFIKNKDFRLIRFLLIIRGFPPKKSELF